jgi:peptide deformylase
MKPPILMLGNPSLRLKANRVIDFRSQELMAEIVQVKEALEEFRTIRGFGRGLAAPQIGICKQIIALNLGKGPFVLVNPEIVFASTEKFTLWDDCMSFPDLLVRVERSRQIRVVYQNESGERREWPDVGQAASELLQHEIDHLNGILAIDRAMDKESIIYKNEYKLHRQEFDNMVDYIILPTIG